MTALNENEKAPEFTLPTDGGGELSLSSFNGKKVVLYFYPKDDTPGCTKQACALRDHLKAFNKLDVAIIGVSKDPVAKHDKFRDKYELNFPLASDENGSVCEDYGVWVEKNMYGKKFMGIERTTFLIDEDGVIEKIWRKVKVDGHIDEILELLNSMKKDAA